MENAGLTLLFSRPASRTIADNGPGIADQERRVIEAGEETALRHGSGLGLWTARWGSRMLGGTLRFDTDSPRGTVVSVAVPVNADWATSGDGEAGD